jgi:hypothetical protein
MEGIPINEFTDSGLAGMAAPTNELLYKPMPIFRKLNIW